MSNTKINQMHEVADFSKSFEWLGPSAWCLVVSLLWRYTENIIILETQALLLAVRCACEHYPPSRLLFCSTTWSWLLPLPRSGQTMLCSCHPTNGFCMNVPKWSCPRFPLDSVRSNFADEGSRYFDPCFDPSYFDMGHHESFNWSSDETSIHAMAVGFDMVFDKSRAPVHVVVRVSFRHGLLHACCTTASTRDTLALSSTNLQSRMPLFYRFTDAWHCQNPLYSGL